jgi:uncharacterized membrane protein YedE/YeeE
MKLFYVAALVAGSLFGVGLVVSGMTDPLRVLGFLDIFGQFDPRLIFVLGGAVLVSVAGFSFILRWSKPLFAPRFEVPKPRPVDAHLVIGAAIFGVGWGIAGYCPGPALAGLGVGSTESLWFVGAMWLGFELHRWSSSRR